VEGTHPGGLGGARVEYGDHHFQPPPTDANPTAITTATTKSGASSLVIERLLSPGPELNRTPPVSRGGSPLASLK
jgi:hypothetical protein